MVRNRELNALVGDLELDVTVDQLERRDWDREAVHTVFDGLEFRVLRDRLIETLPAELTGPTGGFEVVGDGASSRGPWPTGALTHRHGELTGLDVTGQWRAGAGDIAGSAGDGRRAACWLDVAELTPARAGAVAGRCGRGQGAARREGAAAGDLVARLGNSTAWPATPSWPPTCCVPTSGCTTWAT